MLPQGTPNANRQTGNQELLVTAVDVIGQYGYRIFELEKKAVGKVTADSVELNSRVVEHGIGWKGLCVGAIVGTCVLEVIAAVAVVAASATTHATLYGIYIFNSIMHVSVGSIYRALNGNTVMLVDATRVVTIV